MNIVGRRLEKDMLARCLDSGRPEFVAVYGRRRVGKTYLIREYFKNNFAFSATGAADGTLTVQLRLFNDSLLEHGGAERKAPGDWFEAFARLRALLEDENVVRDRATGRIVVFLDEISWFDTPKSHFKSALEHFWNSWASANPQVVLIVCGSASSWIIDNLLEDTGGFYNRVTRQVHLQPFTLAECDAFYRSVGVRFTRLQVVESYMVFGGVPHYLNLVDARSSLAQNVDQLCFQRNGQLRDEFHMVYKSLFKHSDKHVGVVRKLAERKGGFTRVELERTRGIGGGSALTKTLRELEQCGFIRKARDYAKRKNGHCYQLVDPFSLFHLRFLDDQELDSWMSNRRAPSYHAWRGNSFELACLSHTAQIKRSLGISGIGSREYAWRSSHSTPGAQIDLLIDRSDGVVNICEMKFSDGEFVIDAAYERELLGKLNAYEREANPGKALHLTMCTTCGIAHNAHAGVVQREVTADDLFSG